MSQKSNDFFSHVYEVVRLIPAGRVTSYGAIAHYLGAKRSARMVGWAMNAAHHLDDVPAHRVVNKAGMLTGKSHFGAPDMMQKKLEAEGIVVKDDCIRNFDKVFWDPSIALEI